MATKTWKVLPSTYGHLWAWNLKAVGFSTTPLQTQWLWCPLVCRTSKKCTPHTTNWAGTSCWIRQSYLQWRTSALQRNSACWVSSSQKVTTGTGRLSWWHTCSCPGSAHSGSTYRPPTSDIITATVLPLRWSPLPSCGRPPLTFSRQSRN